MLVKLEDPLLLAKAIEIISELVAEVRIKVNEFGMSIVAIDPANVAMVGFRIPKSAFSQFESGNEVLGINLDNLKSILRRCNSKSSLIIKKMENTLHIEIIDRIRRSFTLSLIDIETEEKEIPNLEFSSKIEINSIDFVDCIEDCIVVSDSCSFVVKDEKFIIEAKGLNSARIEFSGDEVKIEAENSRSKYSLEYLQKFLKAAKICDKTLIQFASDNPLRLDFHAEHLSLVFILAPRVETED
ncbi:MAG: hypothetical protein AABX30_03290 [Nanoarchaeota archaeon]